MSSLETGPADNQAEGGDFTALDYHNFTSSILSVLDEHNRTAEQWLQEHYAELKRSIQAACKEREQKLFKHPAHPQMSPHAPKHIPPPDLTREAAHELHELQSHDSKPIPQPAADDPRRAWSADVVPNAAPTASPREASGRASNGTTNHDESQEHIGHISHISNGTRSATSMVSSRNLKQIVKSSGPERSASQFVSALTGARPTESERSAAGSWKKRVKRFLNKEFDIVIGCLVVVNTVVTFVQLEVETPDPDGIAETRSYKFFEYSAHIFNAIFLVELLVRILVKGTDFFWSGYNWLDAGIVVATVLDTYILSQFSESRQNISFIRMLRFLRLVKALRVIRTMELFRQLRVLLNTIAVSFLSLFWSMLIVFIFMLMFSLLMCQMLQPFITESKHDIELRRWVFRYYGSSGRALWTVFEATFSGGWPAYARPVVEHVGTGFAFIFALYVTGVVFAMIRIIGALFLKDTLQIAANDADMLVSEKKKEMKAAVGKLEELFQQADKSGDGFLSREELEHIMSFEKVQVWMSVFGLDVTETGQLFDILDDGDGLVSYDEFVGGIMRLKGTSKSQDTITIMRDCERICKYCEATQQACEQVQTVLQKVGPEHHRRDLRELAHMEVHEV